MIDVTRLSYKPGWRFKWAGAGGRSLCVYATTTNSLAQTEQRTTQHQFALPVGGFSSDREEARWVFDCLLLAERHETGEFLKVDGFAPFWPHHADEGDPYDIVDRWDDKP